MGRQKCSTGKFQHNLETFISVGSLLRRLIGEEAILLASLTAAVEMSLLGYTNPSVLAVYHECNL